MPSGVEVLSFADALESTASGAGRHILLGNGFSIAVHESFRYGTLYEQAKTKQLPEHLDVLFQRYGTTNFEEVLWQLDEGVWLANHYELRSTNTELDMTKDYAALKEALTQAIAELHPPGRYAIQDDRLVACSNFLKQFDNVFTTNYDLLLYWASLAQEPFPFKDGFGRIDADTDDLIFYAPDDTSLYFLHGALHLYSSEGKVRKRAWNSTRVPLVDQVRDALERKEYPLIVSEGDQLKKKERIEGSSYLFWCHQRFEGIKGSLFIYGSSLALQDAHLWNAIASGPHICELHVGVFGDPQSSRNQEIIVRARGFENSRQVVRSNPKRQWFPELEVRFFDSATAPVWGS